MPAGDRSLGFPVPHWALRKAAPGSGWGGPGSSCLGLLRAQLPGRTLPAVPFVVGGVEHHHAGQGLRPGGQWGDWGHCDRGTAATAQTTLSVSTGRGSYPPPLARMGLDWGLGKGPKGNQNESKIKKRDVCFNSSN